MTIKPIKPSEVVDLKKNLFPDFVIEAFNELIAKNFRNKESVVRQLDVVNLILEKNSNVTENDISNNNWLDVEDAYRSEGWSVEYDKPGYNESYPATFTFKVKR
jgi:hypothetical protein